MDKLRLTRLQVDALGQELANTTRETQGQLTCAQISAFEHKMESLQAQLLKAQQVQGLTSHFLDVVIRWPHTNLDMRAIRREAKQQLEARLQADEFEPFPEDPENVISGLMSLLSTMSV